MFNRYVCLPKGTKSCEMFTRWECHPAKLRTPESPFPSLIFDPWHFGYFSAEMPCNWRAWFPQEIHRLSFCRRTTHIIRYPSNCSMLNNTQFPDPLGCKTARHLPRWRWYLIARVLDRLAQRDAPRALKLMSMLSNSAANGSENKANPYGM